MRSKPTIFVILTLVAFGVYLATTIPVAVFPEVNFPRVLVGIDNGVAPIDQFAIFPNFSVAVGHGHLEVSKNIAKLRF